MGTFGRPTLILMLLYFYLQTDDSGGLEAIAITPCTEFNSVIKET